MKHRILVVEDEPAVSRGVKDALSFNGYVVDVADDGESGYQLAREHHFDLIILDLMLPGIGGLDVLHKLRQESVQTPVLIQSGLIDRDDCLTETLSGNKELLAKPFTTSELKRRVRWASWRERGRSRG